jgi:Ca2+-transporting ATPase
MGFAVATFIALVANIWVIHNGENIIDGVIQAFILAITIVVVAIPEGLPLSVTIALAYSTKKMYQENNFVRVLAACETMGNATNICSDKTGTLTENRMTVVEGWFGDTVVTDWEESKNLSESVRASIAAQSCINRVAYLVYKDENGDTLDRPIIIGNKTEGALMLMARTWGFDDESLRKTHFLEGRDKVFSFNSTKKRSTAIILRPDGSVRLFCKGASELVLVDCTHYTDQDGNAQKLGDTKRKELVDIIDSMANRALRTLCLSHKDYEAVSALPDNWREIPPDDTDLVIDCVVGIIDPLRPDVKEAVATAQRAGVTVRMVTGDNLATACAIARQCGILTPGGGVIEGPSLRKLSPAELDRRLPNLQVIARSSPEDKYLLVTRLNGNSLPANKQEWEETMKGKTVTWDADRDTLLPGYREEWMASRPDGGQVVGVTGDGTNDAPALKAADVGLSMGITGTEVAKSASDIVILDDKFSSIVKAILWGRSVYDNIRKFLQFQLTVNVVALVLVFVGAVCGFGQPLNAVQMLWVNLVMDTLGALALATEPPNKELLERKPYKRSAILISRPMMRNILVQSAFQLTLLFVLLFTGADLFDVHYNGTGCAKYIVRGSSTLWDASTLAKNSAGGTISCASFKSCSLLDSDCLEATRSTMMDGVSYSYSFSQLDGFKSECLECEIADYVHGTIIFNAFIFCQIFNEYNARFIFDEMNMFAGLSGNYMFLFVSTVSVGLQILIVEIGGIWIKTSPLTLNQWLITIALGAITLPLGVLMRLIPVKEDPNSYFDNSVVNHSETRQILDV